MRIPAFSLLGGVFFLSGCFDHREVACTPEQADYISAATDWSVANPAIIQRAMYMESQVTANEVAQALAGANVTCGVPATAWGEGSKASRVDGTKHILVNIEDTDFQRYLGDFTEYSWVYGLKEDEVVRRVATGEEDTFDVYYYQAAIASLAFSLFHDGSHILLGDHTPEVKHEVEDLEAQGKYASEDDYRVLDAMYAWGFAAFDAGVAQYNDFETAVDTASGSTP